MASTQHLTPSQLNNSPHFPRSPPAACVQDSCPDAVAVLVGNKVDIEELRRVPKADGSSFADSQEMPFFEVSAKTGARVNDIFQFVAATLVARKRGGRGGYS